VVSRESNALAGGTDRVLEQGLPPKYVSDPAYVLGETEPGLDLYGVVNKSPPAVQEAISEAVEALGEHGRVVVRYSGTEPLLRVMVEAETEEMMERWTEQICRAVEGELGT